jgi:hypothetical protein
MRRLLHDVDLPIWILNDLSATQLEVLLSAILFRNGCQELRWGHCGLSESIHGRSTHWANPLEARLPSDTDGLTRTLVDKWSHVLTTRYIFAEQLLKWCEQDLLRILQGDVSILALLTRIDSNCADDQLFLGVDLDKLFLARNLVADGRHRPWLHPAARRWCVAQVALAIQLAWCQSPVAGTWSELSVVHGLSTQLGRCLHKLSVLEPDHMRHIGLWTSFTLLSSNE